MSFPQIENELKAVKDEIREINNSIKQLVMQMQLINLTFERMLKPKQKREYTPIEIKLPDKINPNSDDAKYIERYQNNILKEQEEVIQKTIEERRLLKAKEKQEEAESSQ